MFLGFSAEDRAENIRRVGEGSKLFVDGGVIVLSSFISPYLVDRQIVRELHKACQTPDGHDDPAKGTSLLEVYSLEIQLCTATKNTVHMKKIYPRTLNLNAAVADPRIMGVIRECGGKMHKTQREWERASNDFFEAFKNYDEATMLVTTDQNATDRNQTGLDGGGGPGPERHPRSRGFPRKKNKTPRTLLEVFGT